MDTDRLDHLRNLIEGGLRIKNRQGLDAKSQEFLDRLMEEFNFVATIGPEPSGVFPGEVLGTPEANEALAYAYEWASAKASTSVTANAAKVYIEGIVPNRDYGDNDDCDRTQLLYVISNLTSWRGEHAQDSRRELKRYVNSIADEGIFKL